MSQQCQEVFTQRKTFSLKSHKINWSAVINFTCTNTVSISSTVKNISSTEKRVLQWSCDREELLWWMELKIFRWEKNSATGAPYDHSGRCLDKRVRHTAREFRQRGMVKEREAFSQKNVQRIISWINNWH